MVSETKNPPFLSSVYQGIRLICEMRKWRLEWGGSRKLHRASGVKISHKPSGRFNKRSYVQIINTDAIAVMCGGSLACEVRHSKEPMVQILMIRSQTTNDGCTEAHTVTPQY